MPINKGLSELAEFGYPKIMLYKLFQLTILSIGLLHPTFVFAHKDNSNIFHLYESSLTKNNIKIQKQSLCYTNNEQSYHYGKDLKQNPASVTKLFMTYWGLKKLGAHHRFETKVYKLDNNLYLETGGDPYLLSEQLLLLISKLSQNKNKTFNKLYVSTNILLDWTTKKSLIKQRLYKLFNHHLWDEEIYRRIDESSKPELAKLGKNSGIKVAEVIFQNHDPKIDPILTLKSPPLYRSLKEVNKYSNNFYFDELLDHLGGANVFNQFIADNLEISSKNFHFYSGSGLGENYLRCNHVIKLFKNLLIEVPKNQIDLNHLLPVTGIDQGTLENRMLNWPGSSWAKTGSLPKQGHSAIAGITKRSSSYEFFVFLNQTKKITTIRTIQDQMLEELYRSLGDVVFINYDIDVLDIMKESQVL